MLNIYPDFNLYCKQLLQFSIYFMKLFPAFLIKSLPQLFLYLHPTVLTRFVGNKFRRIPDLRWSNNKGLNVLWRLRPISITKESNLKIPSEPAVSLHSHLVNEHVTKTLNRTQIELVYRKLVATIRSMQKIKPQRHYILKWSHNSVLIIHTQCGGRDVTINNSSNSWWYTLLTHTILHIQRKMKK